MSYARFGANGSDVYVFASVGYGDHPNGWLECCACCLNEVGEGGIFPPPSRAFNTADMLAHLDAHEAAGHVVPASCREHLAEDAAENDAEMSA